MIILVAVAAALLWVLERRERFKAISIWHELEKNKVAGDLELYLVATVAQHESDERSEERLRVTRPLIRFHEYHSQMRDKYERAANRPWLPVVEDPPLPPKLSRDHYKAMLIRLNGPLLDLDAPERKYRRPYASDE